MDLATWQAHFFSARVCDRSSEPDGVYFREQVFGALDVLAEALPELQMTLGEQNFRFFVRELLSNVQPQDALGTTLIEPFLRFLLTRPELSEHPSVVDLIREAIKKVRPAEAG